MRRMRSRGTSFSMASSANDSLLPPALLADPIFLPDLACRSAIGNDARFALGRASNSCRRDRFPPRAPVVLRVAEANPATEGSILDSFCSLDRKSVSNEILPRVNSPHSGLRERTRQGYRRQPGMAARCPAAPSPEIGKDFRKITVCRNLWTLKPIPDG